LLLDIEEDEVERRAYAVFTSRNGVKTRLGLEFFASRVHRQCRALLDELRSAFSGATLPGADSFSVTRKDVATQANGYFDLLKTVMDEAHKGINIQRYKGLGEMNPVQLWDTTMNPQNRTFLRVSIDDAGGADDIFTDLMGDKVEPRREFIERYALSVRELDI